MTHRNLSITVCFMCQRKSKAVDAVFESLCGHEDCPTMSFCGLCLMQWREHREALVREYEEHIQQEHPQQDQ